MTIRKLLFEHYLAWQKEVGEKGTWKQFAEFIGMDHIYLNKIYNGKRKAGEKTVQLLADHFGDSRFYDVVGLDRPEPLLSYTRRNWMHIPEELKKRIADQVAEYTTEIPPEK